MRAIVTMAFGLGLFLAAGDARADHPKLKEAIRELERAKEHLKGETKHEQVKAAHKAVKEAIIDVKESKHTYGGRREQLLKHLEFLDKELEAHWANSRKAIDDAIVDLEFAQSRD